MAPDIGLPVLRRLYAGESCGTARLSDYGERWGRGPGASRCASRNQNQEQR